MKKDGADKRSRTSDLRITNALLYQLSYIGFGIVVARARRELRGDKLVIMVRQVKRLAIVCWFYHHPYIDKAVLIIFRTNNTIHYNFSA